MSDVVLSDKVAKGRKTRPCHWCGESIEVGDKAHVQTGIFDGAFYRSYMHPECHDELLECASAQGYGFYEYEPFEMERQR